MTYTYYHNTAAQPAAPAAGFDREDRRAMRTHRNLPGYQPTPLRDCPDLARELGVASVLVKDESTRLQPGRRDRSQHRPRRAEDLE